MIFRGTVRVILAVRLSSADIVTALYFPEMHVDPKKSAVARQGQICSFKGHACPIQYAALGSLGFFPGGSAALPASGRLHASGVTPQHASPQVISPPALWQGASSCRHGSCR